MSDFTSRDYITSKSTRVPQIQYDPAVSICSSLPNQITVKGNIQVTQKMKRCVLITKFIGILLILVNKITLDSKLYSLLSNHFKCLNGGDGWASLEF